MHMPTVVCVFPADRAGKQRIAAIQGTSVKGVYDIAPAFAKSSVKGAIPRLRVGILTNGSVSESGADHLYIDGAIE